MQICLSWTGGRGYGGGGEQKYVYFIVHSFPRFSYDTWDLLVMVRLLPFVFQLGVVVWLGCIPMYWVCQFGARMWIWQRTLTQTRFLPIPAMTWQAPPAFHHISVLENHGVNRNDITKLTDAGYCTVEAIAHATERKLTEVGWESVLLLLYRLYFFLKDSFCCHGGCGKKRKASRLLLDWLYTLPFLCSCGEQQVKGISEQKAKSLKDVAYKFVPLSFTTATHYLETRKDLITLTTGSKVRIEECNYSIMCALLNWLLPLIHTPDLPTRTTGAR